MRKRTRSLVVVLAALSALALAAVATATYSSPKLSVSYAPGNLTRIVASSSTVDDSTAVAAIVLPGGSTVTTTAAPGTKVGTAKAQVSALALGGALLPLAGDVVVAPAGAVTPTQQAQCTQGVMPQLTLLLVLQAAGQTIDLPAYIVPTSGDLTALGSAQLVFCLPPPDIPADQSGAPFGVKFLSADLTLKGIIGPVLQGTWVGFWTPWNAGVGTVNTSATVVSPAVIAPGRITLSGRRVKGVKRLAGRVTQGGGGIATRVTILAGTKRLATVAAKANGTFTYAVPKKSKATTFRARAVVAARSAPTACAPFGSLGIPCVNPTTNGFTATSRTVRLR
jgi:hypothetical protein